MDYLMQIPFLYLLLGLLITVVVALCILYSLHQKDDKAQRDQPVKDEENKLEYSQEYIDALTNAVNKAKANKGSVI